MNDSYPLYIINADLREKIAIFWTRKVDFSVFFQAYIEWKNTQMKFFLT